MGILHSKKSGNFGHYWWKESLKIWIPLIALLETVQ
jgi:hypothetical protein